MKRFVKFSVHEYMDMYSRTEIMVWEGKNEADITAKCKQYAEDLSSAYSGGPTTFGGILTDQEAFDWLKKEIQSMKYPCKSDLEWIKKTIDAITECYTYITDII
jgi:hypothetical protein